MRSSLDSSEVSIQQYPFFSGAWKVRQILIFNNIGLPFFIMGYFQMYALYRALREDAGELPPMRTRRWKKVLPPEEYARRQDEDEHDTSDTVVDPEAADEVPVMADPYVDEVDASGAQDMGRRRRLPEGTISSRTGSAKITYGRAED